MEPDNHLLNKHKKINSDLNSSYSTLKRSTRLTKVTSEDLSESTRFASAIDLNLPKENGQLVGTPKFETDGTTVSSLAGRGGVLKDGGGDTPSSLSSSSSSSLWLNKSAEEIVEFYRQLGPNWRNEFEKTDLTYSPSSPWYNKEVVPGSGIPVVPNMSREPVGHYAEMLRKRKNSPFDMSTYAVEVGHLTGSDRRASLPYGLNHSPSSLSSATPPSSLLASQSLYYSRPSTSKYTNSASYNNYRQQYPTSNNSSYTRAIRNVSVAMVTKVFTFVYNCLMIVVHIFKSSMSAMTSSSASNEGEDVVDHSSMATHAQNRHFEYKTRAKRASTNLNRISSQNEPPFLLHAPSTSSSSTADACASTTSLVSSWSRTFFSSFYKFSTWLLERNFRLLSFTHGATSESTTTTLSSISSEGRPKRSHKWIYVLLLTLPLALCGFWLYESSHSDVTFSTTESSSSPVTFLTSATNDYIRSPLSSALKTVYTPLSDTAKSAPDYVLSGLASTRSWAYSVSGATESLVSSWLQTIGLGVMYVWSTIWSYLSFLVFQLIPSYVGMVSFLVPTFSTKTTADSKVPVGSPPTAEEIVNHILKDARFQTMLEQTLKTSNDIEDFKAKFQDWSEQVDLLKTQMKILETEQKMSNQVLIDYSKQIDMMDQKLKDKVKCCDKLPASVSMSEVKMYVDGALTEERLRHSLDEAYVNKFDMDVLSKRVNELKRSVDEPPRQAPLNASLIEDMKQSIKHDVYLQMAQHYASLKSEVQDQHKMAAESARNSGTAAASRNEDIDAELTSLIDKKISAALALYDADKTGLTDFALESAGGYVVDIRCTETYTLREPYYVLFGYVLWRRDSTPRKAIQPGLLPGDCWAFRGAIGCLVLKLSHTIHITKFSVEHIPKSLTPNGKVDSAPKKFVVLGLKHKHDSTPSFLGEFVYNSDGPTLQFFEALSVPEAFDMVELKIQSNWGNIEYTCLYRFRVHGQIADVTAASAETFSSTGTPSHHAPSSAAAAAASELNEHRTASSSSSSYEPSFSQPNNHNTYGDDATKFNPT